MKFYCIESTLDFTPPNRPGMIIRLWINNKEVPTSLLEIREPLIEIKNTMNKWFKQSFRSIDKILEYCSFIPNINAIQIKDGEIGVVVYTTAFSEGEDPHG